jgi:hypothetical protein
LACVFGGSFDCRATPTPVADEDSLVGIVSTYCETADTGGESAATAAPGTSRAASANDAAKRARAAGELTSALGRRLA